MADNMIITIGRQFGSGGHEVGRRLAEELGIKLYDKELLKLAARESGICEQVLESYDERPTGSFLYSVVMDVYPSMNYAGSTLNQQVAQAQADTIRKLGVEGNCVIVGRGADYILRDYPGLTTVFIHADLDFRARRVAEYEQISLDKAKDMTKKADKKRASYYNFQTEKKWGYGADYHLCIDTSDIGIEGAVQMIKEYIRMKYTN